MNKNGVQKAFDEFIQNYDHQAKDLIWQEQSAFFQDFWKNKVLAKNRSEIKDSDIDQIVLILDKSGKGSTKTTEAVAKAMIAQGAWRRMFNEIKRNKNISSLLFKVFTETDGKKRASFINQVYKLNEKNKNNLTGKSGNAISAMLAAWDPFGNLGVVSLKHRKRLYDFFNLGEIPDFDKDSVGKKIIDSNEAILSKMKSYGFNYSARTLTRFFYSPFFKSEWTKTIDGPLELEDDTLGGGMGINDSIDDPALFYLESHLEDFLITNWDKTELGKKYDLIKEDGELVSQQYKTGIGRIDILAQDNKTKQYVVIELKKNQSSDDTVGQLARYMGWLEENKTKGKTTKGIIIAAQYDNRLYYALKKMKDTEVYLYRVDFKLEEFKGKIT